MIDRLLVHAHVPRCGASRLNRALFFRCFRRDETILAYEDRFARNARLSERGLEKALARSRLALGHVPYGYFDGLGRWPLYISVFDDPVRRFLSFVGSIMAMPQDAAAAILGAEATGCQDDPDALAMALLDKPCIRLRQANAMTRTAAGLPPIGAEAEAMHLTAAQANLGRANYLVALRDDLPAFQHYLRETLGIGAKPGPAGGAGWPQVLAGEAVRRTAPLEAKAFSPAVIARIEAANSLDMRLHETLAMQGAEGWG